MLNVSNLGIKFCYETTISSEMFSKDTNRKFFRTVHLNTGHMYHKEQR